MGLPAMNITFVVRAQNSAKRLDRGSVGMVLKDAKVPSGNPITIFSSEDIPEELGTDNKNQIALALRGNDTAPQKVVVYVLATAETDYNKAFKYFERKKVDWMCFPSAKKDSQTQKITDWVKAQREAHNRVKAVLPETEADTEGIVNYATKTVNVRNLAKTGLVLNKMFFQERPYYEIIMAAYTKVYRKNKKPYIAQMNGDALEVIEKGKTIPGFHIKQGERILESSYSENTDDMVNRVYVYNSSNKKIGILTNTRWANMYGIFQSAITVDSGNGKQEAMNELKGISKNASLTSTGDYRCVSGLGVIIGDSRTGLKGRFWMESDSHEWKNGSYTMKLDLEFKNIMDTQEEDEEQTSSSLSGLSESSALEDVLNQARSWIGIGENPPGSNHNEITVLYGMDAAWCCMYIWACFNKSGHADLFMGGAKEAYCFNVRDYYQARGKWGSTPKKGALVIYGGQGHIGIVESVNSAGGYTSIEGNYGDDVKRRDSHQNVLGFCYIDYPVTKSAEGSDEVISGTTVAVPGSVAQTGIIKDYTNYSYFFGRWNSGSTQKIIADLWGNNGKQGKNGIATINGYYLIALRPVFGSAGDVVSVVLEDGARFNAIIADEKGDDAGNQWGHVYSGAVSIVEFESLGNSETNNGAQLNIGQWAGKKVTAIINGGRYSGL